MILGIGSDIVEVQRIEEAMADPRFVRRILTEREEPKDLPAYRLAGRWAAKEAIAKAVGVFLTWHDVEIFNDESGRPTAQINPDRYDMTEKALHVSISHERHYAAASAVLESLK